MQKIKLTDTIKTYAKRQMLVMLMLGFSSGLPFLLVLGTLSARLKAGGIDNTSIGFASWIGFAYAFKFIWSPLVDHLKIPILTMALGRRRAWILVSQALIALGLVGMALTNPITSLTLLIVFAVFTAAASATQDIAVDAWRIEAAKTEEQGQMAAMYQLGYRLAIMASGGGALILAGKINWQVSYFVMAFLLCVGAFGALMAPTSSEDKNAQTNTTPRPSAKVLLIDPLLDFFTRYKSTAIIMLALISAYRIPDFVMGVMARPFYLDKGYSLEVIGEISGFYGVWITIFGAALGGVMVARLGLLKSLFIGAVLGSGSNLVYVWLNYQDTTYINLLIAIAAENISGGIAGTVLIAYMSSLTNKAFTATQYALLSSFYALLAKFIGGFSGLFVDRLGYTNFFLATALIGVPAILLIFLVQKKARAC
jgi:PAT family beta-lactamase induction signal transducer AmpG